MEDFEKAETINTYNKAAKGLAQKFYATGSRTPDILKAFSYFNKRNVKVVEIGCGNGRDAEQIIKYTQDYLGIDISEELIRIAKQTVPGAKFEIADIEKFEFPENIDVIFSFASLLHFDKDRVRTIFKKAHKSLNKGGIFYISLKYGEYRKEEKNDQFGTRFFYFYTPEVIAELAANHLEVIYKDFQDLRGQKWFIIILRKA